MAGVPILVYLFFSIYHYSNRFSAISPSFRCIKIIHIKKLLSVGSIFFVIQVCGIVLTQSGNIILTNIATPDDVPEYYIANKYFNILMMFFMIVTTPYWSATTEAYVKREFQWIIKNFKMLLKVFSIVLLIGIIMLFVSPFVINIWTNGKVTVRFIMAFLSFLFVVFYMLSNIFITFINGMGKIRLQLIVTIILVVVFIPVAIVLGTKWGAVGVVTSSVSIYVFVTTWSGIQFKKLVTSNATGIWGK
jgi:O-antigen/teichoic acid export membrane protein